MTTIDLDETDSGDLIVVKDAASAWLLASLVPADAQFDDDAAAWAAGAWSPDESLGHTRIGVPRPPLPSSGGTHLDTSRGGPRAH